MNNKENAVNHEIIIIIPLIIIIINNFFIIMQVNFIRKTEGPVPKTKQYTIILAKETVGEGYSTMKMCNRKCLTKL